MLLKMYCHNNNWRWVFVGHKGRLYFVPFEPWWIKSQVSLLLGLQVSGVPHVGCLTLFSQLPSNCHVCTHWHLPALSSEGNEAVALEFVPFCTLSISCKYNVVMTKSQ